MGREIAAVNLYAHDPLESALEARALFDHDEAFLADGWRDQHRDVWRLSDMPLFLEFLRRQIRRKRESVRIPLSSASPGRRVSARKRGQRVGSRRTP
jgi:hypothetical protein